MKVSRIQTAMDPIEVNCFIYFYSAEETIIQAWNDMKVKLVNGDIFYFVLTITFNSSQIPKISTLFCITPILWISTENVFYTFFFYQYCKKANA